MQWKDDWKSSTTDVGELFVITISMTMRLRLLAMDLASGMLNHSTTLVKCERDFIITVL